MFVKPAWCMAIASKYPSTMTAVRSLRMAARATSKAYSVALLLKSAVCGEFTYFPGWSGRIARPPNATIRPRPSLIGTMSRSRNRSYGPRSPAPTSPAATASSSEKPFFRRYERSPSN